MFRPVLLAGYGIRLAGMEGEFLSFVERLGWPVLATWRAMDLIPDSHSLFFGRPGSIASKYANLIVQSCDLLVSIGARLDLPSIGYSWENFAPKAAKIVEKQDAKRFMERFEPYDIATTEWFDQCHSWREQHPLPESWVDEISLFAEEGDILVPSSSGMACEMFCQRFKVKEGQRVIFSPGLGAMGFALPQAVGAAFAAPDRRVICIEGDGSLQLNSHVLQTIKQHNLNVKLFILENNGYASIRNTQRRFGRFLGCDPSSGLTLPDTRKLLDAYGVEATIIRIDPASEIHPRLTSTANADGTITPGRLEDVE